MISASAALATLFNLLHSVPSEEEEDYSSSSESDAEELCSAAGSRSSLFEAASRQGEGRARGGDQAWGAQGVPPQQEGEGGAESEEARYETCDSGK